ncbi:TetR/AcrR family transcriptional regulator [Actinomadura madurae]|uniref:TetR/AcrR family transcriptional regulator n=2 Tax=Actinomadura madurae TaxID=1993 RepID=UPI002026ACD3|nr:TetR/AcrR family transcriptional regulator [Actinomadura madurae]MCP9980915.1 TetR/AcrR family transcriptional regulator [Actinomadura madurae]MCQ0017110.1 TetR/AcrR family transcriptional regulator [Actinomadura madurae]URM97263.1 TetR/AcrR family transcriptional regulator [Actinomadura madurae]URN08025.1 TetR/AcrR family transcriptional regulator [Actinomadura madurae]
MAEKAPASVWTRPARARREQPALSRDQIVDAALGLLDAEGLDGLSMRRLGTRLNSGATSVYWHVANKDELLELALDRVMAEVEVPAGDGWRAAAAGYARSLRAMIHRHPWTVTLFGSRPMIGPNATRVLDEVLAAFGAAGFAGFDLEYAWSAVVDYVIGAAGSEVSWQRDQSGTSAAEWVESLGPYLSGLDAERPGLAAHIREIWMKETGDVLEGRFAFGLACVLDGLEARRP